MADHKSLAEALAAFQAELPKVRKGETAKVTGESKTGGRVNYSYDYAGLDTVVENVLPVLGKHGLSITSRSTMAESGFMLEVSLIHEGGDRETGYWPLPDPRRVGPQDLGSAFTYGRRYLTLSLTGTFPGGEDDDGAKAQSAPRDSWEDAKPARPAAARPVDDRQAAAGQEPQAAPAPVAPKTSWTDAEVYDIQAKMGTVTLESAVKAYDWMAGKGLHNREVRNPDDASTPTLTASTVIAVKIASAAVGADNTTADVEGLRAIGSDRGLMKVPVSPTETLEQVLHEAAELAAHAAAEPTPGAAGSEND